ncbi:serine 3-dehydrogenase [Pseudomonas simiae]|nr:serine 3-dehydrogenase [Pseudomonas simiae]
MRQDDPHVSKANRQFFDKQRTIEQLTRRTTTWQDLNQNNQTAISYYFIHEQGMGFNDHQKQEARRSIQSWGDVANLAFTENGGQAEGQLTFKIFNGIKVADGAYPYSRYKGNSGGDTRYNQNYVTRPNITHEIGHALGLSHPGDYDGEPDDTKRIYAQDSKAHSVMSYYDAQSSGKNIKYDLMAPMMDDISAIQHKYGANYKTRRENNTYGFNSNTGRDYYSLNSNRDSAAFCIWDGAGKDTLDASGYHTNQVINLRAGSFSDVGNGQGNVSIARGCTIENAIGGSGADALIGNDEDNRLTGGAGPDRLRGGRGADTFVYNHASDSTPQNPDEIMDFTSGTDKIDVTGALRSAGLSSVSVVNAWSGKAGEALLTYDERSGMGSVAIDLNGNGRADLLIKTHGRVKPEDIVPFYKRELSTRITSPVAPTTIMPRFVFSNARDSGVANARLLTNFNSGTNQIDLRAIEKEANTRLTSVEQFTGKIGETIVSFNPQSNRYFIAIDLTGNRTTDFLVKSTQVIKPKDILVN